MRGQLGWASVQGMSRSASIRPLSHSFPLTSRQLRSQQLFQPRQLTQQLRHASSDLASEVARQERIGNARSGVTRFKNLIYGTVLLVSGSFLYLYVSDTRSGVHQYIVPRLIRTVFPDAEDAHHFGNNALKATYTFGVHPRERGNVDAKGDLRVEVFGHVLDNPIGTSAGLDKNADVVDPIFALGPGLVEVGGITPRPQEGNAKPRVWRVPSQNAIINRYGLNSDGADSVAVRLRQRLRQFAYDIGLGLDADAEKEVLDGKAGVPPGSHIPGRLLAVQVAKMKETPDNDIDAIARDYTDAVDKLATYADILVVNVSSPNTPGLRALQASEPLTKILSAVVDSAKSCSRKTKPAVMVKVSPDEDSEEQVMGICAAIWASGVDGVIVGNTTKKRPDPFPKGYMLPKDEEKIMLEMGGYSGPQLFERTVSLVKKYRTALDQGPQETSRASPKQAPSSPSSKQETSSASSKQEASPTTPNQETSSTTKELEASSAPTKQEASPEVSSPAAPASKERSKPDPKPTDNEGPTFAEKVSASLERDTKQLKPLTPAAEAESKQPLIKLPERHSDATAADLEAAVPALSASTHEVQGTSAPAPSSSSPSSSNSSSDSQSLTSAVSSSLTSTASSVSSAVSSTLTKATPAVADNDSSSSISAMSSTTSSTPTQPSAIPTPAQQQEKVIFATGGITNGKQALEVLNAGASVAFVYTAMVYGGAGTISRIKREMREEIGQRGKK